MNWKTTAIVHVTIAVPVEDISPGWNVDTVANEASRKALRRTREHCGELGKIEAVRVTAVMIGGEEEGVSE